MKLYNELLSYSKKHIIPMHMPGHKRKNIIKNKIPYQIDITEIDGFDNLYHPTGILKDCQERAKKLYNSEASYYLVNGSTSGLISAINTICDINDTIILPRNCHKSVYNIIELKNLKTVFLSMKLDENGICKQIEPKAVERAIQLHPEAKCVVITSPTYEGVISDVKSIANIVHDNGMKLIVDEAHGAHLFLENKSAISCDADIVINSLHKTLPALTQTAMLHLGTKKISKKDIVKSISTFNSSSPSYILMASIDECVDFLENHGTEYYHKLKENLKLFSTVTQNLKHLKILTKNEENNFFDFDNTKIVILTTHASISGEELGEKLRENKIEIEMAYLNYVICMTTMFDSKKDILTLAKVLKKIDNTLEKAQKDNLEYDFSCTTQMTTHDASKFEKSQINFEDSLGKTSAEYVWVYPPGIPLLVPGEEISKDVLDYLDFIKKNKLNLLSTYSENDVSQFMCLTNA